jgi:uncharacterized membrane protein (DUF106 family)
MMKRLAEIEKRIEELKEVFREFTHHDPIQIIGVGKDENYFYLEGIYQEFMGDVTIEIVIREIQEFKKQAFNLYERQNYLRIEKIVKYDDRNYLIVFDIFKFEE